MLRFLLALFLVFMIIGMLPAWPYSSGWGYYPSGSLFIIFIVALIFLVGRGRATM